MSATKSTAGSLAGALLVGALVGGFGVGTYATTQGAHEALTLSVGDTLEWRFSIRTDSVLRRVGPSQFACAKPGVSMTLARTYLHTTQQVTADSVAVTCVAPIDTTVTARVHVYLSFHTDSSGLVIGDSVARMPVGVTWCPFVEAVDALGRPRTGRAITLSSSDTTVARIARDSSSVTMPRGLSWPQVCPDTTVDIQKLQWSVKPPPAVRAA